MEYVLEFVLICILQFLGIGLGILQKVFELDKKSPDDTLNEVFSMYWATDRIPVFISAFILVLNLVVHLIIVVYAPGVRDVVVTIPLSKLVSFFPDVHINYLVISFVTAFLVGFFGQKLFYKILGKLEKKVEEKLKLDS